MKKYKNFVAEAGRCWPGHKPVPGKKPFTPGSCVKEEVIQEGRPSQRHPLEGHEYHKKTDAELTYIAKDAHKAAEAMKSHNTTAENKYRDQANDSATVRYWRQKHGMPDWYKKKYGHIKEEVVTEGSVSKEKQKTPYRDINSPEYRAAADKQKQQMAKNKAAEPGKKLADKIAKKAVSEDIELDEASAAWQRKEGKNPEGGLNRKGIASYRRENPGSKLSMAVTTPPSKLKPGSKAANRRKSFCARMGGMPGPMKDEKGRPTRKALSLKKWNC